MRKDRKNMKDSVIDVSGEPAVTVRSLKAVLGLCGLSLSELLDLVPRCQKLCLPQILAPQISCRNPML